MKSLLFIVTSVIFSLPVTFPHAARSNTNLNSTGPGQTVNSLYELGDVSVEIPAPEGFEEASSQLESIRDRFVDTEAAENEMMAVHLPKDVADRLKRGEPTTLTFYTKIAVVRRLKERNFTPSEFAQTVSLIKANNREILDIKYSNKISLNQD